MPQRSPSPLLTWLRHQPQAKFLLYIPALLWAGVIFWFSSRSDLPVLTKSWQEFIFKKTAHLLIYAGLYFWLWWSTYLIQFLKTTSLKALPWSQVTWLLAVLTLYAATDELHQSFTATRHPSPRDILIDLIGGSTLAVSLQHYFSWPKWLKTRLNWLIPS